MSGQPRERELIHDIRNRLTVARANVEAFIDGKLAATTDRLKGVLQSLNQLEELINELRASHHASEYAVQPLEIDVYEILSRERDALKAVAAEKRVTLTIRRPEKTEARGRFIGDPVRAGQIVSNVLLNALRYTPPGGTVGVDCAHHDGQLEVSVTDPAGSRNAESGFRLSIAKEFVESHGGAIEVEKSSSEGVLFIVRLPGTIVEPGKETVKG